VTSPWRGVVALDGAALDVVAIMEDRHLRLYDLAFGHDPRYWRAASPFQRLTSPSAPFLAVCSSRRADSCRQARRFVERALALGMRAAVCEQDLSHGEINTRLGVDLGYTEEVEAFLSGLDPSLAGALARHAP
jgi:arylformamidase